MSNIATYLEEAVMDWSFDSSDMPTAPSNVYLALHDGDPSNDGDLNEIGAADYDRLQTSPTDWSKTDTGGPTAYENINELTFGEAGSDWGTISHVSVWDSQTDGNALFQGALDTSKTVNEGDELIFRENDIRAELS